MSSEKNGLQRCEASDGKGDRRQTPTAAARCSLMMRLASCGSVVALIRSNFDWTANQFRPRGETGYDFRSILFFLTHVKYARTGGGLLSVELTLLHAVFES